MSVLAKYCGPKYSALLYAVPLQFTLAAIFIYLQNDLSTIRGLSFYTLFSLVIIFGFVLLFYFLVQHYNFWWSLGISYLLLFVAFGIYLFSFAGRSS